MREQSLSRVAAHVPSAAKEHESALAMCPARRIDDQGDKTKFLVLEFSMPSLPHVRALTIGTELGRLRM